MFQRHWLYHTLFYSLLSLLVGCSTATPFGSHVARFERHDPWVMNLNPGSGKVEFNTRLEARDDIRLTFAQPEDWPQIAYFELLDEDCEFGHRGHLVYLTEQDGFESIYFSREIPWGDAIQVSLEWSPESNQLGVRVNDQYQQIPLLHVPSLVRVTGQTDSNTLPGLQYQPFETSITEQGALP